MKSSRPFAELLYTKTISSHVDFHLLLFILVSCCIFVCVSHALIDNLWCTHREREASAMRLYTKNQNEPHRWDIVFCYMHTHTHKLAEREICFARIKRDKNKYFKACIARVCIHFEFPIFYSRQCKRGGNIQARYNVDGRDKKETNCRYHFTLPESTVIHLIQHTQRFSHMHIAYWLGCLLHAPQLFAAMVTVVLAWLWK